MLTACKVTTDYSLCQSIIKPDKFMQRANELGFKYAILADINTMGGAMKFMKEAKGEYKKDGQKVKIDIKPIIGVTLDVVNDEFLGTITLLAKNQLGWHSLLKLVSIANTPSRYKDRPTISTEDLISLEESNLIVLTGGYNSLVAHKIIDHEARFAKTFDEAKGFVKKGEEEWTVKATEYVTELKRIFGNDNVYLEVQRENMPINHYLNKGIRWLGKSTNTKCVPSNPIHYLEEEDWIDHHLMLCIGHKIKKAQLREIRSVQDYPFICGPNFFLNIDPSGYTTEEVDNLDTMAAGCETYKIFSNPRLPKFEWTEGMEEAEYLRHLCRDGWKRKIEGKIPKEKITEYADRVKEELDIVKEVDDMLGEPLLSRSFLITQDYVNAARKRGELINYGRGSVAGSIIAYLTNITDVDPIRYHLLFSRFFNKGRITKEKFSLPDCDLDFEVDKREDTIAYIRDKYGVEQVGHVVTYNKLHGKGMLGEILRITETCSRNEITEITKCIPDTQKIAGELQEMEEAEEDASTIVWTLRNDPKKLSKWCYLDEHGKLQGEYARQFEQAIRLEGTLKSRSSHASAIVVAPSPLINFCPMLFQKGKDPICGFEFSDLEASGLLKCDILGVAELSKLNATKRLIRERYNV